MDIKLNYLERIAIKRRDAKTLRSLSQTRRERNEFLIEQRAVYREEADHSALVCFNREMVETIENRRRINWATRKYLLETIERIEKEELSRNVCLHCEESYDPEEVIRTLGDESAPAVLGYCSAQCYTKEVTKRVDETRELLDREKSNQ